MGINPVELRPPDWNQEQFHFAIAPAAAERAQVGESQMRNLKAKML
jgi:hypothetical protein